MITLNNTFHRTSVNTRLKEGKNIVTAATMRRWDRELCDNPECSCRAMNECRLDGEIVEYDEEEKFKSDGCYRTKDGWIVTITDHSNDIDPLDE